MSSSAAKAHAVRIGVRVKGGLNRKELRQIEKRSVPMTASNVSYQNM